VAPPASASGSPRTSLAVWGGCHWDTIIRSATDCDADDAALVTDEVECLGGHGANASSVVTAIGGRATLRAVVGDDARGRTALATLRSVGVGVDGVVASTEVSTGRAYVVNEPSAKRMWVRPATSPGADVAGLWAARLAGAGGDAGTSLVMDVPLPLEGLLERIPEGAVVVWAPGPFVEERANASAALRRVAVVILNAAEHARVGDRATWRKATTETALVVTNGSRGCTLHARGSRFEVAAAPRREVDATGAGDAFAGALAWMIAAGCDLPAAVRTACRVAGACVEHVGAAAVEPSHRAALRRAVETREPGSLQR
jgi:ribokinase